MASTTNGDRHSAAGGPSPLPSGYTKHHIVYLEAVHLGVMEIPFPHTIDVYQRTSREEIAERIKPATIVIANVCEITPAHLDQTPNLQLLLILATGMAWVDKPYYAKRGVTVINIPDANIDAVSEHFLSLYFASRRRVNTVDRLIKTTDEWRKANTLVPKAWPQGPPLGCQQEILGIIGYGSLGHRIEQLAEALSFKEVIVAERKGAEKVRTGRVSFEELLHRCTTIVVACPREPDTINLFDEPELKQMRKDALLVNIARGGIVNEAALAKALKEGWILAAATDVFDVEPNGPGSTPLLPDMNKGEEEIPNLIVSSHVAWLSGTTIKNFMDFSRDSLVAFVEGKLLDPGVNHRVAVHDGKIWK